MKQRISTGVLLFKEEKILLVKHVHPKTGFTWWVPPGGGVEKEETLFEAAQREVWEETGLRITPGKIVYLRQYISTECSNHTLIIYLTGSIIDGKETLHNVKGKPDENFIKELRYFSQNELATTTVFPEILKDKLWKDYAVGFPETTFIGIDREKTL